MLPKPALQGSFQFKARIARIGQKLLIERRDAQRDMPTSTPSQIKITDKHFIDWEMHVFGYGYGTGEPHILEALQRFFASLEKLLTGGMTYDYRVLEAQLGPMAAWLLINTLAHADIISYGTSSRYGWLSQKGECLRDYFAGKTLEELYRAVTEAKGEDWTYCSPDLCQCESTPCKNPLF